MQHPDPSFPPPPPPPQPPLPPGWEKAFDPSSGRPYYANRATKETSWEPPLPPPPPPPRYFAPPPPPPPQPPLNQLIPKNYQNKAPHQSFHSQQDFHNQYTQHQPPNQFNPVFPPQQFAPSFPPPGYTIPAGQPQLPSQVQHAQINIPSKVGYTYSASTATQPGLLVPSVRAMLEAEYKNKATTGKIPKIELDGLTAGAIADLCNVNAEFRARSAVIDKGDFAEDENSGVSGTGIDEFPKERPEEVNQYYLPLRPFELPVAARAPQIETGRVDIRLHSLYSKLNRI